MPGRADRRFGWGVVGGIVVLAVFAMWAQNCLVPFRTAFYGLTHNGYDLDTYRHAVMLVRGGERLYGRPALDEAWFTYPPFAALALAPTAMAPFRVAKWGMLALSFLLLASIAWRALRLSGFRADARLCVASLALATASIDVEPVQSSLWWGQINILVMALPLLDLARPAGARLRGFGVGVAAGIKLTPLVFLPYLLVTRQWRAAAWACGTFAATVAAGFAVAPAESAHYWTKGVSDVSKIAPRPTPANQSIAGVLDRLFSPTATPSLADPPSYAPNWAWFSLAALLGAAGLALAWSARRKGDEVLALAMVGLVGCAVSPFSWGHHWVWFVPLAAWLFARAAGERSVAAALGFLCLAAWVFMWTSVQPELPNAPVLPGYATGVFIQPSDPPLGVLGQLKAAWYPIAYVLVLLIGTISRTSVRERGADNAGDRRQGVGRHR